MRPSFRRTLIGCVVVFALCQVAGAKAGPTPHVFVPVLTDQFAQSFGELSTKFGHPGGSAVNDAGDFAFIGNRGTGLYYRAAGAPEITRAIQHGDEVPGLPGSRVFNMAGPIMNADGVAAVWADVATPDRFTNAILKFDGTTLTTVATGLDTAPGTGGAKFHRSIFIRAINGNGDILFESSLLPLGSTATPLPTAFIAYQGGAIERVAGPGDTAPGTAGGTFTGVTGVALNDSGRVLLNGAITGGSGSSGIFVWESGSPLRKVVAVNDASPLGGSFVGPFAGTSAMRMNNAGLTVFLDNGSLWQNTEGAVPETSVAVAALSAVPAPMGGTFSAVTDLLAFSDSGDTVVRATVAGGSGTFGLFRFRPGIPLEVVARQGEAMPGVAGVNFGAFTAVSVNASGTVSFQGNGNGQPRAIFQKPAGGALAAFVLQGADSPVGGLVALNSEATNTLASGDVLVRVFLAGVDGAHYAQILWSGSPLPLMSTDESLPAGARVFVRPLAYTAAGDYMGISLMRAGGRESVAVFSPGTQESRIVGTDGDLVFPLGGRLQMGTMPSVAVNESGQTVVQGLVVVPGAAITSALLMGDLFQPLQPVTSNGALDNDGRALFGASISTRPIPLNAVGDVAFTADYNQQRGVFVGNPFTGVNKVAIVGDLTSEGEAITAVNSVIAGFNALGQVLFTATTATGQGLYVAVPGDTPLKVVKAGEATPTGGTFLGFGATPSPAFNVLGQVAFVATTSGGPGGGVYLASPSGFPVTSYAIQPIALNGNSTPAGGFYSITSVRPDVVMNDLQEIAFVADVTGGPADSGIFIKRGPAALVTVAAYQGQSAPGTGETFSRLPHGAAFSGEYLALSQTGELAFLSFMQPAVGTQMFGWWHVEPDDSMQPIVIVPSTFAELDGGTVASSSTVSAWLTNDMFPLAVPTADGPSVSGIFVYAPAAAGAATGTGANVVVTAYDAVTGEGAAVTFDNVTGAGVTSLQRSGTGPALPRDWYYNPGFSIYYNVTTTATFTGNVQVCIDIFDQVDGAVPDGAVIHMLHYEGGEWVNVTSSGPFGTTICGTASSLSPFVVALALNETTSNLVQNGDFGNGTTSWQVFATDGTQQDNNYISYAVNNGVFEYYRVPPPSGSNSAVVLQNTASGFNDGDTIVSRFDLGNTSSVRKRISVLIHASNFSDLSVCTFWLPPNTPMRTYAMRTHTTSAWATASISFYAASEGANGGVYQLDNVTMGPGSGLGAQRTDCVDPGRPEGIVALHGPELLTNGDFTDGLASWTAFGTITAQVAGGVAEFIRPSNAAPAGALLQPSGDAVAAGKVIAASFQLGNSSVSRKRVTVILHDFTWGDLAACTFWMAPGQPLQAYTMRAHTTQAWSNATISFYPATTDTDQWFQVDNVSLRLTPSAPTFGSDCVEPFGTFVFPAPAPRPQPMPMPVEAPPGLTAPAHTHTRAHAGRPFQGRRTHVGRPF